MTELMADAKGADTIHPGWKHLGSADYLLALGVAVFCVIVEQIWQAHIGLSLADEGLLWYGVQRILAGEIPIRDFESYEPGRYYFLAAWAKLLHSDGLVMLRYGLAAIELSALFPALLLLLRVLPSRWLLPCFGMLFSLWLAPRHKILDAAAPIWMIYALCLLIVKADLKSHFLIGALAAAMWLIGINHVLYATLSGAVAVLAIGISDKISLPQLLVRIGCTIAGGLSVAVLVVLCLLAIPHYLAGYWQNVVIRLVESGTTNLTVPIPWPWTVSTSANPSAAMTAYAMPISFFLFPAALVASAIIFITPSRLWKLRKYPVTLAAAAATLGWSHHAFSRADLPHLVQSATPLMILLIALPETFVDARRVLMRAMCWSAMTYVSIFTAAPLSPATTIHSNNTDFQWSDLENERLYLPAATRQDYQDAKDIVHQTDAGYSILFVPYDPGLYAVFRLRCPIYNPYCVLPESPKQQQQAIADIQRTNVQWVLFWPDRADGRADMGFDQSDPLIWNYVLKNFDLVKTDLKNRGLQIYRRRTATTSPDLPQPP